MYLPDQYRVRSKVSNVLALLIGKAVRGNMKGWPMVIGGTPGVGKTCALLLMLDHCEPSAKYWTMDEFADVMRQALLGKLVNGAGFPVNETDLKQDIIQSQVVVIDDLNDRDRASDHRYRCLKWLLDARKGWPTIIITNMRLPEVSDRYDGYVASRMRVSVTWLEGKDRRKDAELGEEY